MPQVWARCWVAQPCFVCYVCINTGLCKSGGLFEICFDLHCWCSLGCPRQSRRSPLFFYLKEKKKVEKKNLLCLIFWNTEDSLRKTLCSFLAFCLQIFCSPNVQKSCLNLGAVENTEGVKGFVLQNALLRRFSEPLHYFYFGASLSNAMQQ